MQQTSYIELSKSALEHNLLFLKELLGQSVQFSSVVKGNAYGHGIETFVPMAAELGVEHFSVFSADEAKRVYDTTNGNTTILILGMMDEDQVEWAVENDIEFYVFEFERLSRAIMTARKLKKKAKIHIEMETGMNRTGFSPQELSAVLDVLKKEAENVEFTGFCTHYAGAESIANYYRIKKQIALFKKLVRKVKSKGFSPNVVHSACSAAAIRYSKTHMDMVRVGILQFGFFPNKETFINYITKTRKTVDPLRRVISWKSRVMAVKRVKAGEFVGYGTSYLANVDMTVAVVPVGYAHGFTRSLSNTGRVLIGGQRLPVIGTVNMNMISIDVSTLPSVTIGEEVILIGQQDKLEISVSSFGDVSNQLNYELLTRLPSGIPRIIVD